MSNPFKPGDKVEYAASGHPSVHAVIATYGDNWLWLDDADDVPYTVRTEGYVKAEEPIFKGQLWKCGRPAVYTAVVEEVTPRFVIYSCSDSGDLMHVVKPEEFRKRFRR